VYSSDKNTRQTKRGRGRKRLICAIAHNFFALAGNIFEGVVREIFSGGTQRPERKCSRHAGGWSMKGKTTWTY
jgi:hypothetical protein